MFTWDGLGFLASPVGDSKRLHPDKEICKSFKEEKVFVEADLSKELPKSYRFRSEKGIDAVVEYVYPWLPPRCVICSKWGHLKNDCIATKRGEHVTILKRMTHNEIGMGNEETTSSAPTAKGNKTDATKTTVSVTVSENSQVVMETEVNNLIAEAERLSEQELIQAVVPNEKK